MRAVEKTYLIGANGEFELRVSEPNGESGLVDGRHVELRRNGDVIRSHGVPNLILADLVESADTVPTRRLERHCTSNEALRTAISDLRKDLHPLKVIQTVQREGYRCIAPIVARRSLPELPVDLRLPDWTPTVRREEYFDQISATSLRKFVANIVGPTSSGKSRVAYDFASASRDSDRYSGVIWFRLESDSTFVELIKRLGDLFEIERGRRELFAVLERLNLLLVIDGLNHRNVDAIVPHLNVANTMPGPLRLLTTSSVRLESESIEIGALAADEILSLLDLHGVAHDDAPAELADTQIEVYPGELCRWIAAGSTSKRAPILSNQDVLELLSGEERDALAALRLVGPTIQLKYARLVLEKINGVGPYRDILDRLTSVFVLEKIDPDTWYCKVPEDQPIGSHMHTKLQRELHLAYAKQLDREMIGSSGLPDNPTVEECTAVFRICRAYQLSVSHFKRKNFLLKWLSKELRSQAMIGELAVLCRNEVSYNTHRPLWNDLRLAQCLHIQGKLEEEFEVLANLFYALIDRTHVRPDLWVSFCRTFSELLIDLGHPTAALKLLDSVLEEVVVSRLPATVATHTISAVSYALTNADKESEAIHLNENVLGSRFGTLVPTLGDALRKIRIGIARRQLGDLAPAIESLLAATEAIASLDRRAYSWACINLARCYCDSGQLEEMTRWLDESLEINASSGLVDVHLSSHYREMKRYISDPEMTDRIGFELTRLEPYEKSKKTLGRDVLAHTTTNHIFIELGLETATPYEFDRSRYAVFNIAEPHKIRSRFNRNLVRRLIDGDPEKVLTDIYSSNSVTRAIRTPVLNQLITRICTRNKFLAKKFVYPHVDTIKTSNNSVVLHFAKFFERIGDIATARELLTTIEGLDTFDYFNVSANCLAHDGEQFDRAYEMFENALDAAWTNNQRAKAKNNMAYLIYRHGRAELFQEAAELCEQAIEESRPRNKRWPQRLLFILRLETAGENKIVEELNKHLDQNVMSIRETTRAISDIQDRKVRDGTRRLFSQVLRDRGIET